MKRILLLMLLALISPLAISSVIFGYQKGGPVRHVVVFKFKQGTTEDQIKQVTEAFRQLKSKIPGILSFEHGVNESPEKKNLGFTHVYLVTFENVKARDAYLPHPEHKKFGDLLGKSGVFEDVFVVDFIPEN
jgi:Stress responsive A/B Barrel Domain